MGWQLFPTGIGWRSFDRTESEGTFACPAARCGGTEQRYRHRSGRNWVTVLFVPLIPLNRTGEYVECRRCKTAMPVTAVLEDGVTGGVATGTLAYPIGDWSVDERSTILDELQERALSYEVDGDELLVDVEHESLVDRLVTEVTGRKPGPADDGRAVVYSMAEWTGDERSTVLDQLQGREMKFSVEGDELVVAKVHEDDVDALIVSVAGPDLGTVDGRELGYSSEEWTVAQRREIEARCRDAGVGVRFDSGELVVGATAESTVDAIVKAVTGQPVSEPD